MFRVGLGFGVLIIRILLFRVLYLGPLFSETPTSISLFLGGILRHCHIPGRANRAREPASPAMKEHSMRLSVGILHLALLGSGLFWLLVKADSRVDYLTVGKPLQTKSTV